MERGVDVIIAQGGEAGGYGAVAALALIPQVVDAVRPLPVVAAGGIADGRGLAAALVLGAAQELEMFFPLHHNWGKTPGLAQIPADGRTDGSGNWTF